MLLTGAATLALLGGVALNAQSGMAAEPKLTQSERTIETVKPLKNRILEGQTKVFTDINPNGGEVKYSLLVIKDEKGKDIVIYQPLEMGSISLPNDSETRPLGLLMLQAGIAGTDWKKDAELVKKLNEYGIDINGISGLRTIELSKFPQQAPNLNNQVRN